ncbi:MAG: putative hydroxymethylpyrimidine transporter CytX [Deltaproteobacteria bacterium]|nr:putative hydroxymethylpyrimidine transporter CytX [Deltaproteobacteria bacterium]
MLDIRPLSAPERNLRGIDFFLLWAGVAISLAEIWAGGFLAPMGLWLGLTAIIIGHVIGNTFMGLGGLIGSDHGIMSMVSVRPSFGIRGSYLPAVLNIIQLIGWAAIMLIIAGRAGTTLAGAIPGVPADARFWIVTIGFGTLLWALLTGKTIWKIMQTLAVIALMLVVVMMSFVSFGRFYPTAGTVGPGDMPFMIGLDLVIAMPISWLPLVADYSRFSARKGTVFWNTWWGYFIVSSWMYVLGLVATLATGETDPGGLILRTLEQIGFAVPALILVIFSTITSDFPDVYSATCSIMNISDRAGPKTVMWIAGILSIVVALFFPIDQYENFLLFIGAMFVPLFGVVLVDYFVIRKRKLVLDDLYRTGGAYWYYRGVNITAMCAWAAGFATFEVIAWMKWSVGGSLPSMAVAGLFYYLATRMLGGEKRGT